VAAGAWGVIEALPRIVKPGESKKGLEMGILGPVHHSIVTNLRVLRSLLVEPFQCDGLLCVLAGAWGVACTLTLPLLAQVHTTHSENKNTPTKGSNGLPRPRQGAYHTPPTRFRRSPTPRSSPCVSRQNTLRSCGREADYDAELLDARVRLYMRQHCRRLVLMRPPAAPNRGRLAGGLP